MEYPTDLKIEASDFEALARDSGRTGTVVGRQSEKRALYQWIDAAARSQKGTLLFLTGPSGSGKTRLVHTTRSRALNRGFVVCAGTLESASGPYARFVDALQQALESPLPPLVRKRLQACLRIRPELSGLIGWPQITGAGQPHPAVSKNALFQALAHAFILLSGHGPALLIVEDLHLCDDTTLEFLEYLAVRIRIHPLLVLATCRMEEGIPVSDGLHQLLERLDNRPGISRIVLGGLNAQETDSLIRSIYKKNLFSEALRQGILRATGGYPAAILEVLNFFQEQGIIYQKGGIWRESRSSEACEPPLKLYQAIVERLEKLSSDTVHFLRLAAASGSRFHLDLIQQAMGINRVQVLKILSPLIRNHRVIVSEDKSCAFASTELQTILYERTPPDQRQCLHLALGNSLEKNDSRRLEEYQEVLAEHYYRGGDFERALPFLVAAGEWADKFSSPDQAARYYEQALDAFEKANTPSCSLDRKIHLLLDAGGAHLKLKNWDRAEAHFRALLDLSRNFSDRTSEAEAWKRIGRIYAHRKAFDQALTFYRRSLRLLKKEQDALGECDVLIKMGSIFLEQGRWQSLQKVYNRAFRIAQRFQHDEHIAAISMNLAITYDIQGNTAKALEAFHRCLHIYRRQKCWEKVTAALLNIGKCLGDSDDYVQAQKYYDACLKLARKRFDIQHEAMAELNLSEILLATGDFREALAMCEKARECFEEIDHRLGLADAYRILGCVWTQEKKGKPAVACFEKSIALNRDTGYRLGEAEACRDYARFLQDRGNTTPSIELFSRARAIFSNLGIEREIHDIDKMMEKVRVFPSSDASQYSFAV